MIGDFCLCGLPEIVHRDMQHSTASSTSPAGSGRSPSGRLLRLRPFQKPPTVVRRVQGNILFNQQDHLSVLFPLPLDAVQKISLLVAGEPRVAVEAL
jgi:hypothetical protein